MMLANYLCKMLNILYHLIQADMTGSTTSELVSKAGGLGIVGGC